MKHFVLALVMAALGHGAQAQPYESIFGKTSTQWVFQWSNAGGPSQDTFIIEKDTAALGITYKKLSFLGYLYPVSVGLIREDTAIGKVWYKGLRTQYFSDADTTERLMFDFSLNAGDSVDVSNHINGMPLPNGYPHSWDIVDSVNYVAGRKHIYFRGACNWYNAPPYEPITFIEGIGCNVSPMFKHIGPTLLLAQYTLCTYKDSVRTFYTNRRYNGACTLPTAITDEPNAGDLVTVSPNPADEVVRVSCPAGEKLSSLVLFNAKGQRAAGREDGGGELTVRGLPPGLYFLQINLAGRPPLSRRVAVQ